MNRIKRVNFEKSCRKVLRLRLYKAAALCGVVLAGCKTTGQCKVMLNSSIPIVLSDGRHVSVDARTVTTSERGLLLTGDLAWAWPHPKSETEKPEKILGVLQQTDGTFVPVPLPSPMAQFPRVAADGPRGWHVLFVEPTEERAVGGGESIKSAALWYGYFDRAGWSRLNLVSRTLDAALSPQHASQLTLVGDELYFAFAFDHSLRRGYLGNVIQGAVMVRIDLGEESAPNLKLDTLVTWAAPANIQLVANSENHFVSAYFSQEEFRNHRVWPHSLIEVPFREGWKLPITLYSDSSSRVIEPRLVQLSGRRAISWKSQRLDDKTERLVTLDSTGRLIASTDTLRRNDHFDLVRVESDRLVWAARGNHERGGLKLFIEDGLRIRKIAEIDLPFKNPAPVVAVLPNSVLLAITTGLLPSEDGVISETYISKVNLRCR